jgi:hypothetical protein
MRFPSILLFTACLPSYLVYAQGSSEAVVIECPEVWNSFCDRESRRYCYMNDEAKERCGACLPNFVDWNARCISQDDADIVTFLEEYAPQFLEPISMQDRAVFLLKAIKYIIAHNNRNPPPSYELGVNLFSADSPEDTLARLGFNPDITVPSDSKLKPMVPIVQSSGAPEVLPLTRDWVEEGAVTSVKDQGRCGSCWAVATAGVIEGAVAIQNTFLQSLSFQQFISCDENNFGCDGGNLVYAMGYSIKSDSGGIARFQDYEYSDSGGKTTGQCKIGGKPIAVTVKEASYVVDFYDEYTFDERLQRMKEAVSRQPVAIVIRSNCALITNYKSGILTEDEECACDEPMCADHAVLLVGFDDTSNPPSWKVKNSWSNRWGEDGYFRIAQMEKGSYGLFGMLLHGVVPDLAYNVTAGSVYDEEEDQQKSASDGDDDGLEWWVYVLIVAGAVGLLCFCFACMCGRKK